MNGRGSNDERSSDESVNAGPNQSAELERKITGLIRFGFSASKMSELIYMFSGEHISVEVIEDMIKRHENDDVVDCDEVSLQGKKKAADAVILELYDLTGHDYGSKRTVTVNNLRTFLDHAGIELGWRSRPQLVAAVASAPNLAQEYPEQIQRLNLCLKRSMDPSVEPQRLARVTARTRKRAAQEDAASASHAKRQKL